MKFFTPILFLIIAGAIFFWYINPAYLGLKTTLAKEAQLDSALTRSRELQGVRDQLLSRYNTFAPDDLTRLQKLVPDHVDNVRLILDLDSMASRYGMRVKDVVIEGDKSREVRGQIGPGDTAYESVILSFTVSGSYDAFRGYLSDLEKSLRLVDVVGLSFKANDNGIYDFTVDIKTYWLKP
jgi:Tfp pilus assembly protein PilO